MENSLGFYGERAGRLTRHHILAKKRGGKRTPGNIIMLDEKRHRCYHALFLNRTFIEAAKVLVRTHNLICKTKYEIIERGKK